MSFSGQVREVQLILGQLKSPAIHIYDIVVMGIRLRAWFVGLQQHWSVRLRACLSLVQLHYDSYYSRHYIMYSDSLQVNNCLVVMELRLRVGFVGPQRCYSGRFRRCLSLVLRCYMT